MKNTFKKMLSVILCAVLLFTTASTAFAAEETRTVVDSGFCGAQGENLTWTLYNDGELVISGEGEMKNYYSKLEVPWAKHYYCIKVITVEEGVTSTGHNALYNNGRQDIYDFSKYYLINLPKSLKVASNMSIYGTYGQTLAVCYAGSKEDWSKVEFRNYDYNVEYEEEAWFEKAYVSSVYETDLSNESSSHCRKMYFNGEHPEAFCHVYNAQEYIDSPGKEVEVYVHFYPGGKEIEKIAVYSINDGKEENIFEFAPGEKNKATVVIPEAEKGELYVRADLIAADGSVIVSSENCHIKNGAIDNRTLGEKIKEGLTMANFTVFFTTFFLIIPMILAPITEPIYFLVSLFQGKFWD